MDLNKLLSLPTFIDSFLSVYKIYFVLLNNYIVLYVLNLFNHSLINWAFSLFPIKFILQIILY